MTARKYVKEAIRNAKLMLMEDGGYSLPVCKGSAPIPTDYRPELDISPELGNQMALQYYQQLIGVLCWMCEIGRIDLLHEVSIMLQLEAVYGIVELK
jgi:hypothetical protein